METTEKIEDQDFMQICAAENLAHLGLIQSHGCVFAIRNGALYAASDNVGSFFKLKIDEILGKDASEVMLGSDESLQAVADRLNPDQNRHESSQFSRIGKSPLELICHRADDLTILEAVEISAKVDPAQLDISADVEAIRTANNAFHAASLAARAFKKLTGFDRAMVYRFLPDETGEVIAESREPSLTPFLGLRYPASDIPANARKLYLQTPIRIVVDARSTPSAMRTIDDSTCNLSGARLRAVSKFHIEYLLNMGVSSTLVTSIIVNGKLWGLVACHNDNAARAPVSVQERCLQLTRDLAQRIEKLEEEVTARQFGIVEEKTKDIVEDAKIFGSLWYAALFGRNRFIRSLDVHGCAICIDQQIYSLGYCPPSDKIWDLVDLASAQSGSGATDNIDPVWSCTNLKSILGDFDGPTAGAAYAQISRNPSVGVALFKNELRREVHWGGNPDKAVSVDDSKGRVSPRQSFDAWAMLMTDVSEDWSYIEVELLHQMIHVLSEMPAEKFKALIGPKAVGRGSFTDVVFEKSNSVVRTIVDDFVPEGIATIAYRLDSRNANMDAFANSAFYKFLGISRSETGDLDVDQVLGKLGISHSFLDLRSNQEVPTEYISPVSGQRMMKVRSLNLLCLHNRDGAAEGLGVIYLHDDTERSRIIEALDAARRQHEVNSTFRTEILGGLSHELRTPLNAIIGYSELVSTLLGEDQEKLKGYTGSINEAGKLMLELVESLLEVSKIEQGTLSLDEAEFNVVDEAQKAIAMVAEHASKHDQSIHLDTNEDAIEMVGDARAFRQILINLLSNAVKFSPPHSVIRTSLEKSPLDSLILKVTDSGPGIPREFRTSIFQPFSQIEGVESRSRPGAGIGLSIVKAYTDLHGGSIMIDSSPTGGSIFTILFPSWRVT